MTKLFALVVISLTLGGCMHLTVSGECEAELKSASSRFSTINECMQYKQAEQQQIFSGLNQSVQANQHYNRQQLQTMQPIQSPKTIDYTCVNNCTAAGNSYPLCESKCSY